VIAETRQAVDGAVTTSSNTAVAATLVPVSMSTPTVGRVLDVMPAIVPQPALQAAPPPVQQFGPQLAVVPTITFGPVPFSDMTRAEIETLLAARESYKRKIFAGSLAKLEEDPRLADAPGCKTAAELGTGNCLLTPELQRQIQAERERAAARVQSRYRVKQASVPAIERKIALIVGINKYQDATIPQLTGALFDARALRTELEDSLGYETVVVEDASKEAIIQALNRLAVDASRGDSVLIYYAGHGEYLEQTSMGYWIPSNADAEKPESWLSNTDISKLVGLIGAQQIMLVSDSCYSGSLAGKDRVSVGQQEGVSQILSRKAVVVLSSGGNEPVSDEGKEGHSVFAWHLMKELGGVSTWQAGGSLYGRLRTAVFAEFPQTPQYGASRAAGDQGNTDYLIEKRVLEPGER
jgi:hypothetical protein